jgi:sialate O-acetylesterase
MKLFKTSNSLLLRNWEINHNRLQTKNRNIIRTSFCLIFLISFLISVHSQVRLPKLISNGMVLQRDAEVKIWGWAAPGELITLQFINSTYHTTTDNNGDWKFSLSNLKAGGPYNMKIIASNTISISDIMIGDVWLCSGQSNMELPMRRVSWKYASDITNCENTHIRLFCVPQKYNFNEPQKDLPWGIWKSANAQNISEFSAVAYFYAKELYDKYKVPVGIINASLGGSPAEAWMGETALKKFPTYYQEAMKFRDSALIHTIEKQDNIRIQAWYNLLGQKDEGYKNSPAWRNTTLNTEEWATMKIPGYWNSTSLGAVNGVVWFRKEIQIEASFASQKAKLIMGRIVDADSIFINGIFTGTTSYQYPPRRYDIPAGVLKNGTNTIVIRVISNSGIGGFVPGKQYEIDAGNQSIDLKGDWQFKLGTTMDPLASQTFIRWKPMGLYNAMINPLLNYRIKGAVWYQGESNAGKPQEYKELLPALIQNWRNEWKQGNFPFLIVQLPNFMEAKVNPTDSNWALMRESQLKALSVPNTALVVTIDLGEWNDIHPLNKKDVGKRLALAARKIAYGENKLTSSGPVFQSIKTEGNKIILTFTNIGKGLIAKDGAKLKYFAIAGADKKFVWANAKIIKNTVIVWNENIQYPIAARYAWADNPEGANLYNIEGLPASPFRTDEWNEEKQE